MNHVPWCLSLTLVLLASGCQPVSTGGRAVVKAAKTTGTVAAKTAGVATKPAGTVANTTLSATGSAAGAVASVAGSKSATDTVIRAAKAPIVIFRDQANGLARQVSWTEGLKLFAASKTAQFDLYLKTFEIVRGSQVIQASWREIKAGTREPELHPGDEIRLCPSASDSNFTRAGKGF